MKIRFTTLSARRIAPTSVYGPKYRLPSSMRWRVTQHARKRLGDRDLDVRIRLVVAQRDVVLRVVLLDQVRFEDQRVRLARHDDRLEVRRRTHQRPRLDALGVVGRDVAPHARAQPLRLADVQHRPLRVAPQIHAGRLGQMRDLVENGRRATAMTE